MIYEYTSGRTPETQLFIEWVTKFDPSSLKSLQHIIGTARDAQTAETQIKRFLNDHDPYQAVGPTWSVYATLLGYALRRVDAQAVIDALRPAGHEWPADRAAGRRS